MGGNEPPDDVRAILRRQTSETSSKVLHSLVVLPPIRELSTNTSTTSKHDGLRRMSISDDVPIYPIPRANIQVLAGISDDDDFLQRSSTSGSSSSLRTNYYGNSPREIAEVPPRLTDICKQIGDELDVCSAEQIEAITNLCRSIDGGGQGLLNPDAILKCVKKILRSAGEGWAMLLNSLSRHGEIIDFEVLFYVLAEEKAIREAASAMVSLPEALENNDEAILTQLPSRATSSQEKRERGRAKLMVDLEVLVARNPELDLERLAEATAKKVVNVEELPTLLQLYGLEDVFRPFQSQIVNSFLTHDKLFHYSAFVECLSCLRPNLLRQSAPASVHNALWLKPALPKIVKLSATRDDVVTATDVVDVADDDSNNNRR